MSQTPTHPASDRVFAAADPEAADPDAPALGGADRAADADWFDPETTTFGDRLAGAREISQMSQQELAKRLGVKLKTLRAWENDLAEPRANRLQMIAGLLNVPLIWLITGEGEGGPDENDPGLSHDVLGILTEIRDLKGQLSKAVDRLGRLEKSLRSTLKDEAR